MAFTIEDMATFCKAKSFVYPNSEIYGGFSGFFDLGALGSELNNNIKQAFWKTFVQGREDVVGIDGTIISHPKVWEASGHVGSFSDMLIYCSKHKKGLRADQIVEEVLDVRTDGLKADALLKLITENAEKFKVAGYELDDKISNFNLMFKTFIGPSQSDDSVAYLRPETAQLIFTNFKLIMDTARTRLPFGIAQVGKAFRNEISPRDFLFRCREFEQFEIEFFINPEEKKCALFKSPEKKFVVNILTEDCQKDDKPHYSISLGDMVNKKILGEWHAYWLKQYYQFFLEHGISPENLRLREHCKDELAHYSSACFDIEYKFPFGWKEIHGCANRGQFDLTQHIKHSKQNLEVFDENTQKKVVPRVIEPSQGVGRAMLTFLFEAYDDDKERGNIVLKLHPTLAPYKVGVFPLVNKLTDQARKIFDKLKVDSVCFFDKSGSIGRRYARADEIGIPYCITFDFESIDDKSVTIRDRDTTKQKRVKISRLQKILGDLLSGKTTFDKVK